ncbi:MAG: virulence RhuM family protein [Magnetococcales bacterium]|nr:virulence RhuM family protein [Magnetococcales bacterium]
MATDAAPPAGEILLYQTEDGRTRLQVVLENQTLWLNQKQLAELFGKAKATISEHTSHIFEEGELKPAATVRYFRTVQMEGSREVVREVEYYNLDVVLALGYRVRSPAGVRFRQWASDKLKEYIIKGFVLDDERLKNPPVGGSHVPDYFDGLLERIRDIRASERRMYLRVREIFTLAADYVPSSRETTAFFKQIQNKLHCAVTGQTAPEWIAGRANHALPNMGLTTWKDGVVRKGDVTVAKNYLQEQETAELNRIVVMWLDFAEDQARRRKQVFLQDWEHKLDEFLRFNDRAVLPHAGQISRQAANDRAEAEYELFAARRRTLLEAEGEHTSCAFAEIAAKMADRSANQSGRGR